MSEDILVLNRDDYGADSEAWQDAHYVQQSSVAYLRMSHDEDEAYNGEKGGAGKIAVMHPLDEGDVLHFISEEDVINFIPEDPEEDRSIPPANEHSKEFLTNYPPMKMLLFDRPYKLDAPEEQAKDGHKGWNVEEPIVFTGLSGEKIEGYPLLLHPDFGPFCDPYALNEGDYKIVSMPIPSPGAAHTIVMG